MKIRTSAPRFSSVSPEGGRAPTTAEEDDLSVLRRPLSTALTGFQEAKKAYENGTEEVRRLLLHECSLIYECNVCRNMFRSLANFISHKRIFCCSSSTSGGGYGFPDRNSGLIIHDDLASTAAADNAKRSRSTGASPVPRGGAGGLYGVNGGLSNVIERLRREQVAAVTATTDTIPTTTVDHTPAETSTSVLQLERVPTTSQAVYQTLKREEADSMRTEVDEVHNLLSSHWQTVLGPDGKAMTPTNNSTFNQEALIMDANSDITASAAGTVSPVHVQKSSTAATAGHIMCDTCNLVFQTEKTLKLHIQKKHISSAYVFQCPTCSMTFMQPAAVIRHLANEHKKPVRRIRMMRETILKRRIQAGDVKAAASTTGPNRELKRLQAGGGVKESDNVATEERHRLKPTCVYCAKSFERRAALSTHLSSCRVKYEAQKSAAAAEEEEAKHLRSITDANDATICDTQIKLATDAIKQEAMNVLDDDADATDALNELFANLDKQTFGPGLQTVKLEMCETEQLEENVEKVEKKATSIEAPNDAIKVIKRKKKLVNIDREISLAKDRLLSPPPSTPLQTQPSSSSSSASPTAADCIQTDLNPTMTPVAKKKQRRFRVVPSSASATIAASKELTCRCKICNKQFNALSNLRRHISMFHYRARKFGCKLCDYRAFRRYDIVNHLGFVHKMQGEREAMSAEWVNVHEVHYSKDDVDGDIVLCTDEIKAAADDVGGGSEENSSRKTYAKRGKRKKTIALQLATVADAADASKQDCDGEGGGSEYVKTTRRRQLKRTHASQHSVATTNAAGHKRPIRNRIKTANKDFVYDLSNLLKTETDSGGGGGGGTGDGITEPRLKRRNMLYNAATGTFHSVFESGTEHSFLIPPPLTPGSHTASLIKGAARRLALALVAQGRAASSTLPELPAERPQMRPRRLTATQSRLDMSTGAVIESSDLEAAATGGRLKTSSSGVLFEDSFLEKIARRSGFRMKPLLQVDTALNTLLQKVNSANSLSHSTIDTSPAPTPATTTIPTIFPNKVPNPAIPGDTVLLPQEINGNLHNPPPSPATAAATPIDFISYQVAAATTSLEVTATFQPQHSSHLSSSDSTTTTNGKHFFIEPEPSIPKSSSPPPTPRKRITLMQRLAENKASKNRESLLRSALENQN